MKQIRFHQNERHPAAPSGTERHPVENDSQVMEKLYLRFHSTDRSSNHYITSLEPALTYRSGRSKVSQLRCQLALSQYLHVMPTFECLSSFIVCKP